MQQENNPAKPQGKVLQKITFTDEQKKIISQHAGREIGSMNIVELASEEAKRLAPGVLRAVAVVMCW